MITRKLINIKTKNEVEIQKWFIIKPLMWEYYVIEQVDDDNVFCIVMGEEIEIGSVYLPEVDQYIAATAKGKDLFDLMPPEGWDWVDDGG